MDENIEERNYNYQKIDPAQAGSQFISSKESFNYKLLEVAINKGSAELIDQIFFNELSVSNLTDSEREYVLSLLKAAKLYLFASRTNKISGRKYDLTSNILSCYERARSVCITTKGLNGWGMDKVLNPRITRVDKFFHRSERGENEKNRGFSDKQKNYEEYERNRNQDLED